MTTYIAALWGGPKDGERIHLHDNAPAWLRYPIAAGPMGWRHPIGPGDPSPTAMTHCYERTAVDYHPSGAGALARYTYIGERS